MATQTLGVGSSSTAEDWTAGDLLDRFGPILLRRIRFSPPPGSATEDDVVAIWEREKRLCELVDGTLVEKAIGLREAHLALFIGSLIREWVSARDLGIVLGADGMAKLAPGLIRIPDVSYIAWERFATRRIPAIAFLPFAPDLAVEVLSPSNTAREMERKLLDDFGSGVRLVWFVDPATRSARSFTGPDAVTELSEADALDGGDVLPGFSIPLTSLFSGLEPKQATI